MDCVHTWFSCGWRLRRWPAAMVPALLGVLLLGAGCDSEQATPPECSEIGDCPFGHDCIAQRCYLSCFFDDECGEGEVCHIDYCAAPCQTGSCLRGRFCDEDGHCIDSQCGNGVRDPGEACDDGNSDWHDGCAPLTCAIEYGWSCGGALGGLSTCSSTCGDGQWAVGAEGCDDGDTDSGDGCSDDCSVEPGWQCDNDQGVPSQCSALFCGDGVPAGAEQCDDGNHETHDGCPSGPDGSCVPAFCGDGYVFNISGGTEQCDDGNGAALDGCAGCQVEANYTCTGEPSACGCSAGFQDADSDGVCEPI